MTTTDNSAMSREEPKESKPACNCAGADDGAWGLASHTSNCASIITPPPAETPENRVNWTDSDTRGYPHPDYTQRIVFEGCDTVAICPEDYECLFDHAADLQRRLTEKTAEVESMKWERDVAVQSRNGHMANVDDLRAQLATERQARTIECESLKHSLTTAQSEAERLREDAKRLDWIEGYILGDDEVHISSWKGTPRIITLEADREGSGLSKGLEGNGDSLRSAIDAARQEAKP